MQHYKQLALFFIHIFQFTFYLSLFLSFYLQINNQCPISLLQCVKKENRRFEIYVFIYLYNVRRHIINNINFTA
jgi:hypothetical protein